MFHIFKISILCNHSKKLNIKKTFLNENLNFGFINQVKNHFYTHFFTNIQYLKIISHLILKFLISGEK